ncbi:xanthine dehydrogenase small subunit [Thiomicrorhabdus sp.]|uniref:xanthine dehydrogenase small subunit n=1 Tax=Thiomicrorhabdus sp. TaxID=2039724 RepID=UPI002AA75CAC|nr:xanthine dehydrogenase small subunit [Thiomicrorhabdus sp.]
MNSNNIQFLLNKRPVILTNCSPTLTLLNYLRNDARLVGTKEGCAEGDCGACTVVLGELINGKLTYRAVNACILFVSMLDGKQVLTVEHLKTQDGALHPVQQEMVNHHASQCGFCTPGIVMSGFALYQNTRLNKKDITTVNEQACENETEIDQINALNKAYAGNLCRCTGYGPIIESGKNLIKKALEDQKNIEEESAEIITLLKAIQPTETKKFSIATQTYIQPSNITDLTNAIESEPEAHILAGATDLGLWVTKQRKKLETLIYLGQIPELKRIKVTDKYIELGASVTYSEAMPILAEHFPEMDDYLERHSSTQIRNSGTIVGNIANGSPIGDMPPPLIALGASIVLSSINGSRTLALQDYFIAYGQQDCKPNEFIECVRIPLNTEGVFKVYKISKRFEQDISSVSTGFYIELVNNKVKTVRLCYGGMAGTPLRASKTEAALINQVWSEEVIEQACLNLSEDYQPLDDFRASSQYRMTVAKNLLRKFFIETQSPDDSTPKIAIQVLHTGEIKHA